MRKFFRNKNFFLKEKFKNYINLLLNYLGYKIVKKSNIYIKKFEGDKNKILKFDFIIFHSGRTGSKALQSFLNFHPEAYTISRKELDKCMSKGNAGIKLLLNKYFNILDYLRINKIKSVLVIHDHKGTFTHERLQMLRKLSDNAILITRNPIETLISASKNAWYYSINPIAYKLKGWQRDNNELIELSNSRFNKKSLDNYNESMKTQMANLNLYSNKNILSQYYKTLKIFDFEVTKSSEGIQKLFKHLKISSLHNEAFDENQNGRLQRYLRYSNFKKLFFKSFYLTCRFDVKNRIIFSNDEKYWLTILEFDISEENITFDNKMINKISILCPEDELNMLSVQDRDLLLNNESHIKDFKNLFILTINQIKKIELVMKNKALENLSEKNINRYYEILKDEIENFVEELPEFNAYL